MEILMELLIDLAFEGTLAASTNRKIPSWIRYVLIGAIALIFAAVVVIILLVGLVTIQEIWYVGLPLIALAIGFAFLTVRKFRRVYIEKREDWD